MDRLGEARELLRGGGDRRERAARLAALMLKEALQLQTRKEKRAQAQLARMMTDPRGKMFTMAMTDECFRSNRSARIANQLIYLLNRFGIPKYLSPLKKFQLAAFKVVGPLIPWIIVPIVKQRLRKETAAVILPGERRVLKHHMAKRRKEGVRLNLNHLGEAILGEKEAETRLKMYLADLKDDSVEYVSVKISTIYSQIHLLGWEETLDKLADRLRELYRAAKAHSFKHADGRVGPKFVNLDMEEYRDLHLTKELFKRVLSEPEFLTFSAGIVLQAYLPDGLSIQKELTKFAMERMKRGGAPIKIRIVKGANLAMEQVEASLRDWEQAPYTRKIEVDANYKQMVEYGCKKEHAKAVHLGIGSHNLLDIAYALILRAENGVEDEISFEMLEGMADHIRKVVQQLAGGILLYCPVARKEDFQSAIAYLIRRLDENTGPENFLRHTFGLKPGTAEWQNQVAFFGEACDLLGKIHDGPRRTQNRLEEPRPLPIDAPFENESDTDFSLEHNREWAEAIVEKWSGSPEYKIPLVIGGKEIHHAHPEAEGFDPSEPSRRIYRNTLATWEEVDEALTIARAHEKSWSKKSPREIAEYLHRAAQIMRERRNDLLGVMMLDGGKTIPEGDPEVSEAIDFAEYYLRSRLKMGQCKDIEWKAKGTILITPPWNFPVAIPAGGIFAALAAGNCVIFKPAPETVLTGWVLVQALWDAGIPKEVLQFINCADDPVGSRLIADPRISAVILTGATSTAKLFYKLNPKLDLAAETGGKNGFIISGMSDRDLAIKELVHSAFGHAGQKCSAASLAVLEAEVYDDPHFKAQLKDAVESLAVGSAWNMKTKIGPLVREAEGALLKGLTTLEAGEEWLVKPKQDPNNPQLWSPGVKWGVQEGSFMHMTELFGPVLAVMRAKNLSHAIDIVNATPYGLTSGLHSLDERQHRQWINRIEAGNIYINRSTTGAIVRRQPFGGCKASCYGPGAKAGGPNYVMQFARPKQISLPQEKSPVSSHINRLDELLTQIDLTPQELGIWHASMGNYAFWNHRFSLGHDPSKIVGQDNIFGYTPQKSVCVRIQPEDHPLDVLRTLAAALTCRAPIEVSWQTSTLPITASWHTYFPNAHFVHESDAEFNGRLKAGSFRRIRLLSPAPDSLQQAAAASATHLATNPVLANGRFELLHYMREVSLSRDYHRYGNLGVREGELRKKIN